MAAEGSTAAPRPSPPSTAATDRREKRLAYRTIPSLVDCLIVSQDAAEAVRYTRDAGAWTEASFARGESIELASVDLVVAMDDLYAGVPLDGA